MFRESRFKNSIIKSLDRSKDLSRKLDMIVSSIKTTVYPETIVNFSIVDSYLNEIGLTDRSHKDYIVNTLSKQGFKLVEAGKNYNVPSREDFKKMSLDDKADVIYDLRKMLYGKISAYKESLSKAIESYVDGELDKESFANFNIIDVSSYFTEKNGKKELNESKLSNKLNELFDSYLVDVTNDMLDAGKKPSDQLMKDYLDIPKKIAYTEPHSKAYNKWVAKANAFIQRMINKARLTGLKENFGQKELRKFEEELDALLNKEEGIGLSYAEISDIKDIARRVSNISDSDIKANKKAADGDPIVYRDTSLSGMEDIGEGKDVGFGEQTKVLDKKPDYFKPQDLVENNRDLEIRERDIELEQAAVDEYEGQLAEASPELRKVLEHIIEEEKEHRRELEEVMQLQAAREPLSLFNVDTAADVVARLKAEIKAPFVSGFVSTLGGKENVSIMFQISMDPKDSWHNNIFQNSRFCNFSLHNDGELELFTRSYLLKDYKFRKRSVKTVDDVIKAVNDYVASIPKEQVESGKNASIGKYLLSTQQIFVKEASARSDYDTIVKKMGLLEDEISRLQKRNPSGKDKVIKERIRELSKQWDVLDRQLDKLLKKKASLHDGMRGNYKGKDIEVVEVAGNDITIKYLHNNRKRVITKADLEEGIKWEGSDKKACIVKKAESFIDGEFTGRVIWDIDEIESMPEVQAILIDVKMSATEKSLKISDVIKSELRTLSIFDETFKTSNDWQVWLKQWSSDRSPNIDFNEIDKLIAEYQEQIEDGGYGTKAGKNLQYNVVDDNGDMRAATKEEFEYFIQEFARTVFDEKGNQYQKGEISIDKVIEGYNPQGVLIAKIANKKQAFHDLSEPETVEDIVDILYKDTKDNFDGIISMETIVDFIDEFIGDLDTDKSKDQVEDYVTKELEIKGIKVVANKKEATGKITFEVIYESSENGQELSEDFDVYDEAEKFAVRMLNEGGKNIIINRWDESGIHQVSKISNKKEAALYSLQFEAEVIRLYNSAIEEGIGIDGVIGNVMNNLPKGISSKEVLEWMENKWPEVKEETKDSFYDQYRKASKKQAALSVGDKVKIFSEKPEKSKFNGREGIIDRVIETSMGVRYEVNIGDDVIDDIIKLNTDEVVKVGGVKEVDVFTHSASDIGDEFEKGNYEIVKKWIGNDLNKFQAVLKQLEYKPEFAEKFVKMKNDLIVNKKKVIASLECIIFDKDNKEIDSYDPIKEEGVKETPEGLNIVHESGTKYFVPKSDYDHFIIREIKESSKKTASLEVGDRVKIFSEKPEKSKFNGREGIIDRVIETPVGVRYEVNIGDDVIDDIIKLNTDEVVKVGEKKATEDFKIGDTVKFKVEQNGIAKIIDGKIDSIDNNSVNIIDNSGVLWEEISFEFIKKYANKKIHLSISGLFDFDLAKLDPLEVIQYDNLKASGRSKEEALQIIINTYAGDISQLSKGLAALVEANDSKKKATEDLKVGDLVIVIEEDGSEQGGLIEQITDKEVLVGTEVGSNWYNMKHIKKASKDLKVGDEVVNLIDSKNPGKIVEIKDNVAKIEDTNGEFEWESLKNLTKKAADETIPTTYKEHKIRPDNVDPQKIQPVTDDIAKGISEIEKTKSRLDVIAQHIKDLQLKFEAAKKTVEEKGEKVEYTAQLQNMVDNVAALLEKSRIETVKFGDNLYTLKMETKQVPFKPSDKWKVEKLLERYSDASDYLEKAVAGAQNMAETKEIRELIKWPERKGAEGDSIVDTLKDAYDGLKGFFSELFKINKELELI